MTYPVPEPVRRPVMLQNWRLLTFLHWRYPPAVVAPCIPPPLAVETFAGSAWVGVVPFVITNTRPPILPPLPWISRFPETNCRTYVTAPDGSSGVWFFSLDAARAAAVAGARIAYGLPYAWSKMRVEASGQRVQYRSKRRWPDASAHIRIEVEYGAPMDAGDLEIFLTARFRLFSFIAGRLTYTNVEHAPYPLRQARVIEAEQSLTSSAGLPHPEGSAVVHYSPGADVRIALPRRV